MDDFPILGGKYYQTKIFEIPMEMIESHHNQAIKNHSQSLDRLRERGGLSSSEALAIIEDRTWISMDQEEANKKLISLVENWMKSNG